MFNKNALQVDLLKCLNSALQHNDVGMSVS